MQYNVTVEGTTKLGKIIAGSNWLSVSTVPAVNVTSVRARTPTTATAVATPAPGSVFVKYRWFLRNQTGCPCPSSCCVSVVTSSPTASFNGLKGNTNVSARRRQADQPARSTRPASRPPAQGPALACECA